MPAPTPLSPIVPAGLDALVPTAVPLDPAALTAASGLAAPLARALAEMPLLAAFALLGAALWLGAGLLARIALLTGPRPEPAAHASTHAPARAPALCHAPLAFRRHSAHFPRPSTAPRRSHGQGRDA